MDYFDFDAAGGRVFPCSRSVFLDPTCLERGSINYLARGISKSHARVVDRICWGLRDLHDMKTTVRLRPRVGMKIPSQRSQHLIGSSDLMSRFYVVSENATSRDFGLVADWSHSKDVIFGLKDDRQPGSSKVCPERKLAVAVFSQAANDLQKFRYARRGAGYSLYADARKWIASNDRLWPYSFLNLCDALHLAADVIRAELLGNTSRHSLATPQ